MSVDLPNLADFLGTYLNQDWKSDYPNMEAVVDDFKRGDPPELVADVVDELEILITRSDSDASLGDALEKLGCYLAPEAEGMTNRQWAQWLLHRLKEPVGERRTSGSDDER